jgi:1,4-dihydroxy-6-naphthoate synthase
VLQGKFDAGVIIHESRFTYAHKGLQLIADLGSLWEQKHSLPIPLGGIIGHRRLGKDLVSQVSALIRASLQFAFNNPSSSADFIRCNAVELEPDVVLKHINLYVNQFSLSLGAEGSQAVEYMLKSINGSNYLPQYFEIR